MESQWMLFLLLYITGLFLMGYMMLKIAIDSNEFNISSILLVILSAILWPFVTLYLMSVFRE